MNTSNYDILVLQRSSKRNPAIVRSEQFIFSYRSLVLVPPEVIPEWVYIYINTYLCLERVRGIMYLYNINGAEDSLIPPRSDRFLVPRDPDGHI